MILIYGGRYQGKLDFAKKNYNLKEEDIIDMFSLYDEENFDVNKFLSSIKDKICINNINFLFRKLIENSFDIIEFTKTTLLPLFKEREIYIIAIDESCGLVPLDDDRKYREDVSRCINILSSESKEVYRLFASIAKKVK